jgi:hypothetical protein
MKHAALGLTFLAIGGCASTLQPRPDGSAKLGQVAHVGGLRVEPQRVIEDSRCPIDAQCVWAGRVVLQTSVSGRSWSKQLDLTLGEPVPVAGGRLVLASIQPERTSDARPGAETLSFTFTFQAEP